MKKNMTLSDIRLRGNKALFDELGAVGFMRFMQQFVSRGDYTKDLEKWIDQIDVRELERRAMIPSSKTNRKGG